MAGLYYFKNKSGDWENCTREKFFLKKKLGYEMGYIPEGRVEREPERVLLDVTPVGTNGGRNLHRCGKCAGTGKEQGMPCKQCGGTGLVKV